MVETPAIIIDERKLDANIERMSGVAQRLGVRLRPHTKTHKLPYIAKKQEGAGASGITVAKVSEAEVMVEHGLSDIFIAYPLAVDSKIQRAIELSKQVHLIVGVDSLAGAHRLSELAKKSGITLNVRLEIDTGLRRTGVLYHKALHLAQAIVQLPHLHLQGIYTYKGSLFNGQPTLDRRAAGIEEGELMVSIAELIRAQGIAVEDISVGSTPTAEFAGGVEGVTEIRPGTYVFNDAMQEKLGTCTMAECAAIVTVSIVSIPSDDLIIIDGGSKTFATDVQPGQNPLYLNGFGTIVQHPNAILARMTEEHGMISIQGKHDLKIGDTLQIIPNHICSTINLHNEVYLRDGQQQIKVMEVLGRGKLQ